MSDWFHSLSVLWMALVVFVATYSITAAVYGVVNVLATGERARAFKVPASDLSSVRNRHDAQRQSQ